MDQKSTADANMSIKNKWIYFIGIAVGLILLVYWILTRVNTTHKASSDQKVNPTISSTTLQETEGQKYTFQSVPCNITVSVPSQLWSVRDHTISQKNSIDDPMEGCLDVLASDYSQGIDVPDGFFIDIIRLAQGAKVRGATVNTLEDYANLARGNYNTVTIGSLTGLEYETTIFGPHKLKHFIFSDKNHIYDIFWPSDYSGSYKDELVRIITSITFSTWKPSNTSTWKSNTSKIAINETFTYKYPPTWIESSGDGCHSVLFFSNSRSSWACLLFDFGIKTNNLIRHDFDEIISFRDISGTVTHINLKHNSAGKITSFAVTNMVENALGALPLETVLAMQNENIYRIETITAPTFNDDLITVLSTIQNPR